MKILLLATATAASLLAAPPAQAHPVSWELHPTGVDVRLTVAGSTFAQESKEVKPIKALLEHMQMKGIARQATLYWGGRRPSDLYMDAWVRERARPRATSSWSRRATSPSPFRCRAPRAARP